MGKSLHGDMPWPSPPTESNHHDHMLPEEDIPSASLGYKPLLPPNMAHNSPSHGSNHYPQSPASAITRQLPSPVGPSLGSTCMQPTWRGFIHTTRDGLMILEACLQGQLMHIPRRPHDRERQSIISSGNIFVYEENASGIRRWTDGITWSPSRIMGNFLVYRELRDGHQPGEKKRAAKKRKRGSDDLTQTDSNGKTEEDRQLIGSLSLDAYNFKPGGLAKKTLSVELRGVRHHIISYYRIEDIKAGMYRRPIHDDFLSSIEPRRELTENPSFKFPVEDRDDKITVVSPTGQMQPNHHLQMVNAGLPVVVNVPQPGGHLGLPRSMPGSGGSMMYHNRTAGPYQVPMGSLDPFDIEGIPQSASSEHAYTRPTQAHSASPTISQHPHGSPTEPSGSKSLHLQTLRRIHTNSNEPPHSSSNPTSATSTSGSSLPSATTSSTSDLPSAKRSRMATSPHTPHTPQTPHMLYGWDQHHHHPSTHHSSPHSSTPYSAGGPMSDWGFTGMQTGHGGHQSHHNNGSSHHQSHHNSYQPHHQAPSSGHHGSHNGKYVEDVGYHGGLLGNNEFPNPVGVYMMPQSGTLN
jgi:Gti1/Pac2 family